MVGILLWAASVALSGWLYYLGGEEGRDTLFRDALVPLVACSSIVIFSGFHWSLIFVYGLMWGALTTYHKWINRMLNIRTDTVYWFNWLTHGMCIGLSIFPYILLHNHNWLGFIAYVVSLGISHCIVSEAFGDVKLEAGARGGLIPFFAFLIW